MDWFLKTLYTTCTYFSTSFVDSIPSVSSSEAIESNMVTLTKVGNRLSRIPEILTTLYTTLTTSQQLTDPSFEPLL